MQSVELPARAGDGFMWRGRVKRAAIVSLAVSPFVAAIALRMPICPSATFLKVPCPGCGLTRATLAALGGHFSQALHFHPLVFVLTPLYVGFVLTAVYTYVRGPKPGQRLDARLGKIVGIVMSVVLLLMIAVWALRFFGWFGGPAPIEPFRGF